MRLRRPSPSLRAARILLALSLLSLLVPVSLADASAGDSTDSLTTSQLLSKANALLATGQTASALSLYDEALSRDPSDYLTLYRKGATHLALGHLSAAADAFERVLGLSEYEKARLQLAKIALRNGEYDKGDVHVGKYLGKSKDVEGEEVRTQLKEARSSGAAARKAEKAKRWEDCVNEATKALVVSAHSSELRLLRADCSIAAGDLEGATGDLTRAVQLSPHSSHLALRLSLLQALYLSPSTPISKALAPIRACLHSDPDSKPCRAWFRRLKALDKDLAKATNFIEASSWRSVVNVVDPPTRPDEGLLPLLRSAISDASSSGVLPSSPILTDASSRLLTHLLSSLCRAHLSLYQTKLSRPYCEAVLARDPEDIFALVGKGERLMDDEAWEEAVRVLSQAFELGGKRDRDVLQRLQKAQKGLKVSKQKDYYKVIGVPRDVDARTLKKAYRKATLKAHPDKGGSEEKMQALNEAYEVLSNPELRARYDNGDDPNDHSQQAQHPFQQGASPIFQQFFQQGGSPFGGGGGGHTFEFRFG